MKYILARQFCIGYKLHLGVYPDLFYETKPMPEIYSLINFANESHTHCYELV